ncbi:hypothetical protein GYMLUDRAFT_183179, partial [Collybiopsis luxurians FD-317 M1]
NVIHTNMERQFHELIVKPCDQLTVEQWKNLPQLIVFDGLDECIDIVSQEHLLFTIRKAKSLPSDFLICSRHKPHIWNAFSHEDFGIRVTRSSLVKTSEST